MPRVRVILEVQGPLLLGDGLPTGNVQSSRLFVAGSVLRGTLAKTILAPLGLWRHSGYAVRESPPPEPFQHVFLGESPARFGFLYPVRLTGEQAEGCDAFPLPLTAMSCKAHQGFRSDGGHGVFDQLLSRLRRAAGGGNASRSTCPACGKRLNRMRGFALRQEAGDPSTYRRVKVRPRAFVRVGLNRLTETAEAQILYTLEALVPGFAGDGPALPKRENGEPPLSFVGYWMLSDEQWAVFQDLLRRYLLADDGGRYPLRIGSARARGMGKVRLHWVEGQVVFPALEQRVERFQPRSPDGRPMDPEHLYFALTLRSPLLLYDDLGRPTTRAIREVLEVYVSTVPTGLEVLPASVVEQEPWTGWSAAWGLPKPVVPAITAGSVLAFRAPAAERERVIAFLREAEEDGLGERRAEGWGDVVACDPFHEVFDQTSHSGGAQ
ncbi:MAG: CRISPR-associated RAMP protein Csx10 [Chloroflexi bacterium]|nr:MAG: CRISPR-associated RAMP protein Csx10 [Chloroflexota bacterium]